MSSNAKKGSDVTYWINVAITVALTFGIGYLQPWGSLTELGMKVMGIFLGLLWGWTTLGFVFPSLLGIVALGLSGYQAMNAVLTAGFGAPVNTVLCIFLFIFANYMDHIGLSKIIANWFISRKMCVGRPYVFTLMIFVAAYVLGATVSLFTAILLLYSIFYSVCDTLGYKKMEKYPVAVIAGIVYSAMLGFALFPFKAVQVMVLGSLSTVSGGLTVDFGKFTILTFLITAVCLAVYMLIMKFVVRPDMSKFDGVGDMFEDLRKVNMNLEQKLAFGFLALFMFAMFAPSVMPGAWGITKFFNKLGVTGSLVFVLMLMAVLKVNGKISFDFAQSAKNGMNWEMIIMFAATMPVSSAMSNADVGVIRFICDLMEPLFGNFSGLGFCVLFLVVCGLLTQVAHNLVLAAILEPVLYQFCITMGADPLLMSVLFSFAIATAVATPGGSATAALLFTNEWIGRKNAYIYGWLMAIISIIVVVVVGLGAGSIIF